MRFIDPTTAHTAEDFVLLLRQVRALSELSYWQIEERAAEAGHAMEPWVVAEALGGDRLPAPDLVAGLLFACGYGEEQVGQWLQVHDSLASQSTGGDTPPVHRPQHGLTGRRRAPVPAARRLLVAVGLTVILVTAVGVILMSVSGPGDSTAAQPPSFHQGDPTGDPVSVEPLPPSASAEPTVAASEPPTASPSQTPPAQPSVAIHRSGTATLDNGQGINLDTGAAGSDVIAAGDGDGVRGGTSARPFAVVPDPSKAGCAALPEGRWDKSVHGLKPGTTLCVRTGSGYLGRITVTGVGPLSISYVLWS